MSKSMWQGVIPAITTPFAEDGAVDHAFLARHALWQVEAGCTGVVPFGSLGEGATLSFAEKIAIVRTLVAALGDRAPVIPGIAALATDEAVRLARACEAEGARGLMVLPPYAYSTDWREMGAHVRAVVAATGLPVLLYNNPLAYRTDFAPEQIVDLAAEFPQIEAVKESSGDLRRFAAIQALAGDRLVLMTGIDDAIVEGIAMGATGWIAGQVNAYPAESVALFERARAGGYAAAKDLYDWFLPILRLDTGPKFVQLIKLTQQCVGWGSERVRAPRLVLDGAERAAALQVIEHAIATRPGTAR
ncbi:dihydrodipicolinate synthase family protein [Luteimonas sp. SJ-92]|uniref:Dihydrodipicolinate synthase family protein n=1 Tax=Luteimonas salinisoli TaxID=2752307 RepID=A0A853J897_9GAMM|nr:dihydrodipicolinate synthase family protein [Luteimonas salinisoli]NZA25095.1 dihydrodipicolinate synthase family protein [Luteimonas salinisoli]